MGGWTGTGLPKGLLPDSFESLRKLAPWLVHHDDFLGASVADAALPLAVDWGVGWSDQGASSRCTGEGTEKMVYGTAVAGGYAGDRGSPIANYAYRAEEWPALPVDAPLPDEGAQISTIVRGLARFGALAAGDGPTSMEERLDFVDLLESRRFLVPQVCQLVMGGDALIAALKLALTRGCGCYGQQVDKGYESLTNGQVWAGPDGSPPLGGHCQSIGGYRQGTDGLEFKIDGSWGPGFGSVWIPATTFARVASSVYVGKVVPKLKRVT